MPTPIVWEKISDGMVRSRTPTGWLVREVLDRCHIGPDLNEYVTSGYDWTSTMVFIPDPDGLWLATTTEQKG